MATHSMTNASRVEARSVPKEALVLKRGGRLVSMLEPPREDPMKDLGIAAFAQFTQVTTKRLTKLAELVNQGVLEIRVDITFALEQAGSALLYLEEESRRGKVVLTI